MSEGVSACKYWINRQLQLYYTLYLGFGMGGWFDRGSMGFVSNEKEEIKEWTSTKYGIISRSGVSLGRRIAFGLLGFAFGDDLGEFCCEDLHYSKKSFSGR